MASVVTSGVLGNPTYPTTDGKPMAETDYHRDLMNLLIEILKYWFGQEPMVYVSGNLLVFFVPGNKRRHISPDVFVVKGVHRGNRLNYLIWEEGKSLDLAIEITSSSTRSQDVKKKYLLYQDVLKVSEYFLFDPMGDYLDPPLRGFRLRRGKYRPIRPVKGRLPSRVLGLHLEQDGQDLRFYDPAKDQWLPTPQERIANAEAEIEHLRTEVQRLGRQRKNSD